MAPIGGDQADYDVIAVTLCSATRGGKSPISSARFSLPPRASPNWAGYRRGTRRAPSSIAPMTTSVAFEPELDKQTCTCGIYVL